MRIEELIKELQKVAEENPEIKVKSCYEGSLMTYDVVYVQYDDCLDQVLLEHREEE